MYLTIVSEMAPKIYILLLNYYPVISGNYYTVCAPTITCVCPDRHLSRFYSGSRLLHSRNMFGTRVYTSTPPDPSSEALVSTRDFYYTAVGQGQTRHTPYIAPHAAFNPSRLSQSIASSNTVSTGARGALDLDGHMFGCPGPPSAAVDIFSSVIFMDSYNKIFYSLKNILHVYVFKKILGHIYLHVYITIFAEFYL